MLRVDSFPAYVCQASKEVRRGRAGGDWGEKEKDPSSLRAFPSPALPFLRLPRRLCKAVIFARWKVSVEGYLGVNYEF